ncbi:hypothetical protein [Rachiplusia nu nucleopolyhedrovirus]|uniref:Uncharacterized protein n=1 Tax=Rachiplusia nu nucleopolyhedrovirus TaxID=2605775 RepID=A0AAF1DB38_9ABAC|nr:hypothetical protein QKQ55_gp107 [Rachiplusia nu nucleopolyhedrovirus]QEI03626.1 hypothetical protein [Rachiplusia nu nucleopolyhedrovirus]
MNEYSTSFRAYRELASIKRALWLYVSIFVCGFAIFMCMASYAGSTLYSQMDDISLSIGAETRSLKKLQNLVVEAFEENVETEKHFSLILRSSTPAQLKINLYPESLMSSPSAVSRTKERLTCPGSVQYENYIRSLYDFDYKPDIHNVYLFYGGHGLGKSYSAQLLGKAISRFRDTVVISAPMTSFLGVASLNSIGHIIQAIETVHDCYVIWMFDELDSYLLDNRDVIYQSKSITEFAEYTGFVDNRNRILAFTMNNGELLKHDYWAHQNEIANGTYEFERDFRRALSKTGMTANDFLTDGQLSRLRSFVGNKMYKFKRFSKESAKRFINLYLSEDKKLVWTTKIEQRLFGVEDNSTSGGLTESKRTYDVRTLLIALDDVLNHDV